MKPRTGAYSEKCQYRACLEAQFGPNTAIFANVDYETGLTDGTADILDGTAGLRFNF